MGLFDTRRGAGYVPPAAMAPTPGLDAVLTQENVSTRPITTGDDTVAGTTPTRTMTDTGSGNSTTDEFDGGTRTETNVISASGPPFSISFNTDGTVNCGNDPSVQIGAGNWSFAFRFKTSIGDGDVAEIVGKYTPGVSGVLIRVQNSQLTVLKKFEAGNSGATHVNDGVWHDAIVEYDGTDWSLFIDGVSNFSYTPNTPINTDTTSPLRIGSDPDIGGTGLIEVTDVSLWGRTLSSGEALDFHNFVPVSNTSLLAKYDFAAGSGSTLADSSGNGNNGTLSGDSTWSSDVPTPPISGTTTVNVGVEHDIQVNGTTVVAVTAGGVVIGDDGAPDASAIAEDRSTTKGRLPPRATTTQKNAIASPAPALTLFDTTLSRLAINDGSGWKAVAWTTDPATFTRVAVSDIDHAQLVTEDLVAYMAISAPRVVTIDPTVLIIDHDYGTKDESGSCSGINTITITPSSGTVDGAATFVMNLAYGSLTYYTPDNVNLFTR